jgi:small subunit ribosomal protein S16
VAVKIKLKRLGKIRAPYYRIVVADARTKRDGRAIEEIGKYHPKAEPSLIEVDSERAQHWLSVGAQPTDPVRKLFEVTGDWQKFKGLPGAEGTLRTAEPKADKKVAFAAAVAESLTDSGAKTKPKAKAGDAKTGEAKAEKPAKSERPARAKKPAAESASTEPEAAATETASTEAAATEPASTEAAATEPASTEAAATEPASTEPASAPEAPAAEAEAAATESASTEATTTENGAESASSEA